MRSVPSRELALAEVVQPGARLLLARDRQLERRWDATVVRVEVDGLRLELDHEDVERAGLRQGERVVLGLGAHEQGMLYACEVVVVGLSVGTVTVSTPEGVRKVPRRGLTRVAVDWACSIQQGGAALEARTVNLSASGALVRLAAPAALAPGEAVSVQLAVAERGPVAMRARVVRTEGRPAGVSLVALEFRGLSEVEEVRLQLAVLRARARRYLRIPVARVCRLEPGRGGPGLEGVTDNLCGSGALVRIPALEVVEVGSGHTLSIWLDDRPIRLAPATVTRCELTAGVTLVAIDFGGAEREARSAVVEFVMGRLRRV